MKQWSLNCVLVYWTRPSAFKAERQWTEFRLQYCVANTALVCTFHIRNVSECCFALYQTQAALFFNVNTEAQWLINVPPGLTHKFYVLPTQRIYLFRVDLRTNSDYFTVQH